MPPFAPLYYSYERTAPPPSFWRNLRLAVGGRRIGQLIISRESPWILFALQQYVYWMAF